MNRRWKREDASSKQNSMGVDGGAMVLAQSSRNPNRAGTPEKNMISRVYEKRYMHDFVGVSGCMVFFFPCGRCVCGRAFLVRLHGATVASLCLRGGGYGLGQ